jgi:periplasmic protein CpxP/Spy
MRKLLLSCAAVLFMSTAACMAQDQPKGGMPDMSKMMENLVKELGLNDKQAVDFKAAMQSMVPTANDGEMPTREEMAKRMKAVDEKIKSILTPEQYTKFKNMRRGHQRPDNNGDNGEGNNDGGNQ